MSIRHWLLPRLFYSIQLFMYAASNGVVSASEGGHINFTVYQDSNDANEPCVEPGDRTCGYFKVLDTTCVNFNIHDDKISAINTYGTCIRVWEHLDCEGETMEITPELTCRRNLKECTLMADGNRSWDNEISSLRSCGNIPISENSKRIGEDTGADRNGLFWVAGVVILLICAGAVGLGLITYRKRKRRRSLPNEDLVIEYSIIQGRDKVSDRDINDFVLGYTDVETPSTNYDGYVRAQQLPYDAGRYEIPAEELEIDRRRVLGTGAYGIVYPGTYKGDPGRGSRQVAVKMIRPGAGADIGRAMLAELKVMMYISKNDYTAELVGACTGKFSYEELCLVLPLYSNGSLDKYLKGNRESFQNTLVDGNSVASVSEQRPGGLSNNNLSITDLIRWAQEIAEGMHSLSTKKVIHGDLSTRNLLLDDNLTVKITDFGLSRRLYERTQYLKTKQAPLPWKWMPIEALCDMTFSVQSDVWSFGVTLWELFSLIQVPYSGFLYGQEFVDRITDGYRMPAPKYATPEIYELMKNCWQFEPERRPSFEELSRKLDGILKSVSKNVHYV